MTSNRFLSAVVSLLIVVAISACEAMESPTATTQSEAPANDGLESSTPEPAALSASKVFEVTGDPNCCTLGGGPYASFGFRLFDVSDGYHSLTDASGSGSCNAPPQDADNGFTLESDGATVNWSSTVPVGAVIVGSSLGARVYVYSPRSWGDNALHAMIDPATGQPAQISSLEFCYDYALTVTVDAEAIWQSAAQWDIQSTVTPDTWDLFPGDRAHSRADVSIVPSGMIDMPPSVVGKLTIENRTPLSATVSSITNIISGGILVPVDCAASFPFVLAPGESRECSYTRKMDDTRTRTNFVTVNTTSVVKGGSDSDPIVFSERSIVNQAVHVTAPDGSEHGPFDAAADFSVDLEFDCAMLEQESVGSFPQRAQIVETEQFVEAMVSVRKWQPSLTHEIAGSAQRVWSWSLQRELEFDEVILAVGQVMEVDGTIAVSATAEESNHEASGTITVLNPHPSRPLVVTSVEFSQSEATLDCGSSLLIPASDSHRCTFSVASPSSMENLSIVRISYQNFELRPDGSATPTTLGFLDDSAELQFEISSELDRCVELFDQLSGLSLIRCADSTPAALPASVLVGPFGSCGSHAVDGMTELVALDSGVRVSAPVHIGVQIACESACTHGAGYWKSHSPGGPPPYDGTWELLPGQGSAPFFASGMSYVEVMWAPAHGSAWMQLAKVWIAARLNRLAGADASIISAEFDEAESLLRSEGPNGLSREQSRRMRQLAENLRGWNSGAIGPGSCSAP